MKLSSKIIMSLDRYMRIIILQSSEDNSVTKWCEFRKQPPRSFLPTLKGDQFATYIIRWIEMPNFFLEADRSGSDIDAYNHANIFFGRVRSGSRWSTRNLAKEKR